MMTISCGYVYRLSEALSFHFLLVFFHKLIIKEAYKASLDHKDWILKEEDERDKGLDMQIYRCKLLELDCISFYLYLSPRRLQYCRTV